MSIDRVTSVEVAVVGPSFGAMYQTDTTPYFESPPFLDQGPEISWAARRKVVVPIDEDTTLEQAINRAAESLGIRTAIATWWTASWSVAASTGGARQTGATWAGPLGRSATDLRGAFCR